MNNIHLIDPYSFSNNKKKKHWMEEAEEEQLYHRMMMEAKQIQDAQQFAQQLGNLGLTGAGGTPPYNYFNPSLSAAFTATSVTGDAPFTATFTNASSPDALTYGNFIWNFGDGETSTEQNPSHTFANTGSYTVALTANGNFNPNISTTTTTTDYISASLPTLVINYTASSVTGPAPLTVTFTNLTNTVHSSGTNTYLWNFSGSLAGGTVAQMSSSLANPVVTFNSGSWRVLLQVTGSWGIMSSSFSNNYISASK